MTPWLFFVLSILFASPSLAGFDEQVALKSERLAIRSKSKVISNISFSHENLSYLEEEDDYEKSSVITEAKLGMRLWKGKGEIYGVVGAYKRANSLMVSQVRPYLALDMYPLMGKFGQIVSYHRIHIPFSQAEEEMKPDQQGAIYTIGLAPTGILPFDFSWFRLNLKAGVDSWTRLYSRAQNTREDQISDDIYKLNLSASIVEDENATLQTLAKAGFSITPLYLKNFVVSFMSYLRSTHYPYYSLGNEKQVENQYKVKKDSYHRFRVSYAVDSSVVIANDFYYFYKGHFEESGLASGQTASNILKVTLHL